MNKSTFFLDNFGYMYLVKTSTIHSAACFSIILSFLSMHQIKL